MYNIKNTHIMIVTTKIKLILSEEQKQALLETMFHFNRACHEISKIAFEKKVFKNFDLHKLIYKDVKEQFKLSSQFTCNALKVVCYAYKVGKKDTIRKFRKFSAVPYDIRTLSFKKDTVSLLTKEERLKKIPFVASKQQLEYLKYRKNEADLIYKKGKFYLHVSCEIPEETQIKTQDFLGVDLGIVNIASTSEGIKYSGENIDKIRNRYSKIKSKLQSCGSKSATRHLRKISGRQSRFVKNTNHYISKQIVARAKALGFGIALEELSKIKNPVDKAYNKEMKKTKVRHDQWSFFQLRNFIGYKAMMRGIPVILVNPHNTSRTCSKCGCVAKENRKTQSDFICIECGFSAYADINAAINIAARAKSTYLL